MKIYLALPYSNPVESVRIFRFQSANEAAAKLMRQGHIVYSPISMSHPIAEQCGIGLDFTAWEAQDKAFIDWADAVVVNAITGWDTSEGVRAEIEYAISQGKTVIYGLENMEHYGVLIEKEAS